MSATRHLLIGSLLFLISLAFTAATGAADRSADRAALDPPPARLAPSAALASPHETSLFASRLRSLPAPAPGPWLIHPSVAAGS